MPSPVLTKNGTNICNTYNCLEKHDGEIIWVEGRYRHPPPKSIEPKRIKLDEDTLVVLSKLDDEAANKLNNTNDGEIMQVKGRIFTGKIPDEYGVIARTPEPYLIDIREIQIQ